MCFGKIKSCNDYPLEQGRRTPPKDTTAKKKENGQEDDNSPLPLPLKIKPTTASVSVDPSIEDQPNKEPTRKKRRKLTTKRILIDNSPAKFPHLDDSLPSTSLPTKQPSSLPREASKDPLALPTEDIFYPPPPTDPFLPKSPIFSQSAQPLLDYFF